jgi:hypothetical protein
MDLMQISHSHSYSCEYAATLSGLLSHHVGSVPPHRSLHRSPRALCCYVGAVPSAYTYALKRVEYQAAGAGTGVGAVFRRIGRSG